MVSGDLDAWGVSTKHESRLPTLTGVPYDADGLEDDASAAW